MVNKGTAFGRAFAHLSLLATIEEPCRQEDHCHQEGELRMLHGAEPQANGGIDDPDSEPNKPDPCHPAHSLWMHESRPGLAL